MAAKPRPDLPHQKRTKVSGTCPFMVPSVCVAIHVYRILYARRDFSNGYLVAGIFSWYYPQQIEMYAFSNGASLQTKLGNWQQLERVSLCKKNSQGSVFQSKMSCQWACRI